MGSKGIGLAIPVVGVSLFLMLVFFFLYNLLPSVCYITMSQQKKQQQQIQYTAQSYSEDPIGPPSEDDIKWAKSQLEKNRLGEGKGWHQLRKGINPRTREEQLQDLRKYKGISHYDDNNHTAMVCPGELLVEEHHSNYGEPWAGGRDVYEFLGRAARLRRDQRVLEVGCGTLRVALHFIRYLNPGNFHCLERDELSLMAAFRYELPSQGLLHKRPLIVRSEDMDLSRLGREGEDYVQYDLIYASAVFLHVPDALVWVGLERLAPRLAPIHGRLFVSHNIKFCTRLHGEECSKRLSKVGLEYVGKHTHDSFLFNHYEIWFEFCRSKS
ncbi:hypothetical protein KI387_025761 [Taxus chinensis]|uniref:S-adenosylmethionine-dependent methyltransferase n=1 Tax=Taxus chinensis TaxID=29808 RepID=A0AA38FUN1_TAXCH|nr:hypothetical protein KI387_025761 [Taxus chinensis]